MDANFVKILLMNNPQSVVDIITEMGATKINVVEGKRIQFGFNGNSSGRSHCIFLDERMTHIDYPNSITEDVIKMISRIKDIPYQMAISYAMMFLDGDFSNIDYQRTEYFYEDKPLEEYPIEILESYKMCISELFLKDGIPPTTQSKFGIRYSDAYDRILIPIWQKGKLVGIFGRYNSKDIPEHISKYLPILKYQKGKVLFPFDVNGEAIKRAKTVYLVESEKTPILTHKWGWNLVLALGGNSIKSDQIELLKELEVENIILALDKGLGNTYIQFTATRLKEYGFKNVSYIDVENIDYLNDKDCVFDLNNKILIEKTIREYRKEV